MARPYPRSADVRVSVRTSTDSPPDWAERMLDLYADEGALYGHGVWWSVLTAAWQPRPSPALLAAALPTAAPVQSG